VVVLTLTGKPVYGLGPSTAAPAGEPLPGSASPGRNGTPWNTILVSRIQLDQLERSVQGTSELTMNVAATNDRTMNNLMVTRRLTSMKGVTKK